MRSATLLLTVLALGCEPAPEDPLATLGFEVTAGAAPGYISDEACGMCHSDLWESYREVGMARSFYRPDRSRDIEDFSAEPYYHAPSDRYYAMRREGDALRFARWQRGPDGEPINRFEIDVDWILGSGNHARSYLYRTEFGELYQLPINWYSQGQGWGMAPGFEHAGHLGVRRLVRQECMFCHNGYPDVPEGNDHATGLHRFPEELPEGTGCQRCHGPGEAHVRSVLGGEREPAAIRATIVNPATLEGRRRDDVCYQCHLQPSVVLTSTTRFERPTYSFRPGESLAGYKVALDPVLLGEDRSERFEINHHPYRLEQSACFIESDGALSCLSCHDPHRKVPVAQRAAHYRQACASCHELDSATFSATHDALATDDCVGCHMPERRTEDVVHVTMTDHRIARGPFGPELVAARDRVQDPQFTGVTLVDPDRAPPEASLYRAVATLRTSANDVAVDYLLRALPDSGIDAAAPWLDLAQAQISLGHLDDAEATLEALLAREPDDALALEYLGSVHLIAGRLERAAELFARATRAENVRPEALYNASIATAPSDPEAALELLEATLERRPNYAKAWRQKGRLLLSTERYEPAVDALERALSLEPDDAPSYEMIVAALTALDRNAEARRFAEHAARRR